MRHLLKTAAILGGLSVSLVGVSAQAGECGYGKAGPGCNTMVVVHPGVAPSVDPMHVYSTAPMGHLRSVQYLNTPSVNVMRVHTMGATAQLSDAPSRFTGDCMPESTQYCRQMPAAAPVKGPVAMPMMQPSAPMIAPPAPIVRQQTVHVGGGYDASKFAPRTYGSTAMVPGIAHIPTSIVDRSHANAHAVLNSGMTRPQPFASGGMVPHPSMMGGQSVSSTVVAHGSIAPVASSQSMSMSHMSGGHMMGTVNRTVTMAPETNVYPGSMSGDGSYYEKVSGPTMMGGAQATQVICKRQAPQVNVQHPVVGVPTPTCVAPMHSLSAMPQLAGGSRYGH